MSYASGSLKISIRPDRLTAVDGFLKGMLPDCIFDSCWFHFSELEVTVELTFSAVTRETLKAIESLHETAWPGLLDSMEGGSA